VRDQGGVSGALGGRKMMQNLRNWLNSRRGAWVGVVAGLLFLATATVGQAVQSQAKGREQPVQGQQLFPATPGTGQCQLKIECPPSKAPGESRCRATIDCPGVKEPVELKKKRKTE
jgi:hypothetical protein